MTQQATTADELAFNQPHGEQEQQILTPEAVEFLTELVFAYIQLRGTCGRILIHGKQAGVFFTRLDFVGNRKWFGSSLLSGVCRCGRRGYYGCFIIALRHAGHAQQQCCR